MLALEVNGKAYQVDVDPDMPLLWVLRDHLALTGTKYGCGVAQCGACTVHINGGAERSCQVSAKEAEGKKITTIEGIPENHPVKKAWLVEEVSQCGYCQPGQIMAATAFLFETPRPRDDEIDAFMSDFLCRCGSYPRIRRAIRRAAQLTAKGGKQ